MCTSVSVIVLFCPRSENSFIIEFAIQLFSVVVLQSFNLLQMDNRMIGSDNTFVKELIEDKRSPLLKKQDQQQLSRNTSKIYAKMNK